MKKKVWSEVALTSVCLGLFFGLTAAPLGVYGWSKFHGEEAVRRVGCRHVILRTAWLFSDL